MAQVLSYVGLRHHSLLTSSSPSPSFKPLSVVELPELEVQEPPSAAAFQISGGRDDDDDDRHVDKLTV